MAEVEQLFKCSVCGQMVFVTKTGAGELKCCEKPMDLVKEITEGDKAPKHLPVITKGEGEIIVNVGEAEHPMEEEHFIEFIKLSVGNEIFVKDLAPGDKPELVAKTDAEGEIVAKAYCNLHGYWVNKL